MAGLGVSCSFFRMSTPFWRSFPGGSVVKNLLAMQETGFDPWVKKIPWRRKWQPTPVFLPGESHGQKRLVAYHPWGWKESDRTERLNNSFPGPWCPLSLCFLCLPGTRSNLMASRYLMLLFVCVSYIWALWMWGRASLQ